MKKYLTLAFILSISFLSAQTDWKEVISNDNVRVFVGHLGQQSFNDCQKVNETEYHLLSLAIKYDADVIFNHIIKSGDIDFSQICQDKTILMYAVKYGNLDIVKKLIEAGADPTQASASGKTLKDYAMKYKKKEIYDYFSVK